MKKLVLLSVIIASIVIPVRASRSPDPRAGLKRTLKGIMLFNVVYLFLLLYVWHRL